MVQAKAKQKGIPRCTRPNCTNPLGKGKSRYCSEECYKEAQKEMLDSYTAKRREERAKRPPTKCAIPTCTGTFHRTSSSHKYCSDKCSMEGLLGAIQRQKARREARKEGVR